MGSKHSGCERRVGGTRVPTKGEGEREKPVSTMEGKFTNVRSYLGSFVILRFLFNILHHSIYERAFVFGCPLTVLSNAGVLRCNGGQILFHRHEVHFNEVGARA